MITKENIPYLRTLSYSLSNYDTICRGGDKAHQATQGAVRLVIRDAIFSSKVLGVLAGLAALL